MCMVYVCVYSMYYSTVVNNVVLHSTLEHMINQAPAVYFAGYVVFASKLP